MRIQIKNQTVATECYRRNYISSLKTDDGSVVEDHAGKESVLFEACKTRMGQANPSPMKFNLDNLLKDEVLFATLAAPFTHNEIDAVVSAMPPDRAPGPDGFNGVFLKACWPILKEELYLLCRNFTKVASIWKASMLAISR